MLLCCRQGVPVSEVRSDLTVPAMLATCAQE